MADHPIEGRRDALRNVPGQCGGDVAWSASEGKASQNRKNSGLGFEKPPTPLLARTIRPSSSHTTMTPVACSITDVASRSEASISSLRRWADRSVATRQIRCDPSSPSRGLNETYAGTERTSAPPKVISCLAPRSSPCRTSARNISPCWGRRSPRCGAHHPLERPADHLCKGAIAVKDDAVFAERDGTLRHRLHQQAVRILGAFQSEDLLPRVPDRTSASTSPTRIASMVSSAVERRARRRSTSARNRRSVERRRFTPACLAPSARVCGSFRHVALPLSWYLRRRLRRAFDPGGRGRR